MRATWRRLMPKARGLGPYVLMELLLPGGTLLAILFWLCQGGARTGLLAIPQPVAAPVAVEQVVSASTLAAGFSGAAR
jgi:hypothetical protein